MPEYSAIVQNGKACLIGTGPARSHRWLEKHDLKWIRIKMELVADHKDPKTAQQLGYFWGLLLPEIHKQMLADGQTQTVEFKNFTREIKITETACYEIITELCGRIGLGGDLMRLSDCELQDCRKFIDNVLDFAGELSMNTDELRAQREIEL